MSGKAHCQLTTKGLAGFVPPFEGYAFDAPSNSALVDLFISYAESNPRDWDKNVYSVEIGSLSAAVEARVQRRLRRGSR